MSEPTEDDLSRDLAAEAEYVHGYIDCADGPRMHTRDATYRLQRVSRIAESAIRRAIAAEAEVKRLHGIIESLAVRIVTQSELLSKCAEKEVNP